ncbi:MAG: hypothetical protein PHQ83_08360 [Eubacteriales bacterium]|nr:hypothetical protein [Eubacteriales bacterium]
MSNHLQVNPLSAPAIDRLLFQAEHLCDVSDEQTKKRFFEFVQLMEPLSICGDDELRELWVFAPRGSIDEFADYDEYLADGEIENRQEFEELWLDMYPDELKWYRLATLRYRDIYSVAVNRKLVLQLQPESQKLDSCPKTELLDWLIVAVQQSIQLLKSRQYDAFVKQNLPHRHRVGNILRQDYWSVFPEEKEAYLAEIDPGEMTLFEKLINQPSENIPAFRLSAMTSGLYFNACKLGYVANQYEGAKVLPAKELYRKHADGRDDGLLELDEDSAEAFETWYFGRKQHGGHPWEVCRGGNSTHISLFVIHDAQGWSFKLAGSSMGRSVETVKFYLTLAEQGYPVSLSDGKEILAMLKGEDYIGIVPQGVFPRYCDSFFPGEKLLTFMNLPFEKTDQVIQAAFWYPIERVQLRDAPDQFASR